MKEERGAHDSTRGAEKERRKKNREEKKNKNYILPVSCYVEQ